MVRVRIPLGRDDGEALLPNCSRLCRSAPTESLKCRRLFLHGLRCQCDEARAVFSFTAKEIVLLINVVSKQASKL